MAWQTPKTNWSNSDGVTTEDLNRIEGNIYEIEKGNRTPNDSSVKYSSGNLQQIIDTIATQLKAILGASSWTSNVNASVTDLYYHMVNYNNPHNVRADQISDYNGKVIMTSSERSKLNGIEYGATRDLTSSEILQKLTTVDGIGSGLDGDYLDGINPAYLAHYSFTVGQSLCTNGNYATKPSGYSHYVYIPTPLFMQSEFYNSGHSGKSGSGIEFSMDVSSSGLVTANIRMSDGSTFDSTIDNFWCMVYVLAWR